jgi:hypothetical protein
MPRRRTQAGKTPIPKVPTGKVKLKLRGQTPIPKVAPPKPKKS